VEREEKVWIFCTFLSLSVELGKLLGGWMVTFAGGFYAPRFSQTRINYSKGNNWTNGLIEEQDRKERREGWTRLVEYRAALEKKATKVKACDPFYETNTLHIIDFVEKGRKADKGNT
jgi:hypothetical protein